MTRSPGGVTVSVTAAGRIGATRVVMECQDCGATESRYVARGTVSVDHVCGEDWRQAGSDRRAA